MAISTAVPSAASGSGELPASTRPTICHGAGPRTAHPSTLDVGNAGRSVSVTRSSASVSPSASSTGVAIGVSTAARPAA